MNKEGGLKMYSVYVEYYYESDTHPFNTLKEAEKCFNKYSKYANTIVELWQGNKRIKSNNKEYLRG